MISPQERRDALYIALGVTALIAAFAVNVSYGESGVGSTGFTRAIIGGADELTREIALGFRAPRALIGALAGAALAVSGALMQSVLRNPIASPGILGVSSGAFLALAAGTILAPELIEAAALPLTMLGGMLAAALVYLLAGARRATPLRTVLAGLIVGLTLDGLTDTLLLLNENQARSLIIWSGGSLTQTGWTGVRFAFPWVIGCLALTLVLARQFDLAVLDGETARALGQRTEWLIGGAIVIVLLLTGVTVATVGPVGFIGLVAPQLVKLAGIRRHRILIPASALTGATLLLLADAVSRSLNPITQSPPLGAVTAMMGAPCLIWLAVKVGRARGSFHAAGSLSVSAARLVDWRATPVVLAIALIAVMLLACTLGLGAVGPARALLVFTGADDDLARRIVIDLRLPRVLVAAWAGAAFAVAGALLQATLQNPLADSSLIGVSGGATVAVLVLMGTAPGAAVSLFSLAALAGGLAAAFIVYSLGSRAYFAPSTLLLLGVGVAALCGSVTQILVHMNIFTDTPLVWLVGGIYARSWHSAWLLIATVTGLIPVAWLIGRWVEILAFDSASATAIGLNVPRTRLAAGLVAVALAALAVSQTGPIGYLGLLAPHAARMLSGPSFRSLVISSALLGAIGLVLADMFGRVIVYPSELPAGAVMAVVGAPYLIYLLRRSGRA